jgi:hypothetical protein
MSRQKITNISSLKELRLERDRLIKESEIAQKAIGKSLQNSQRLSTNFLLKTVIAPAGAAGAVFLLASRLGKSFKNQEEAQSTSDEYPKRPASHALDLDTTSPSNPAPSAPSQGASDAAPSSANNRGINWSALIEAGKFLVPLVRMIVGVVSQEMAKREQKA